MKYNSMFLMILFTYAILGCNNTSNNLTNKSNSSAQPTRESYLSGQIGPHQVVMKLITDNDQMSGEYRYLSQSEFLNLDGQINTDNTFKLNETNSEGKLTGIMEGVLSDNGTMSGNWNGMIGKNKKLSFNLKPISKEEFLTSKQPDHTVSDNDLSGMYHVWIGGEDMPTGQVYYDVKFIDSKNFTFTARGEEMGGTLDSEGKGKMIDEKNGVGSGITAYSPPDETEDQNCTWDCTFKFIFHPTYLEASENNCEPMREFNEDECIMGAIPLSGYDLIKLTEEERKRRLNP